MSDFLKGTTAPPSKTVIEWVDSNLLNGQVDESEYPMPAVIRSVGWLLKDNPDYVVIARDGMDNGDFRGLEAIPKCCIVSQQELAAP